MSKKVVGSPSPQNGEAVPSSEHDLAMHFLQEGGLTDEEQNNDQDAAGAESETDLSQDQPEEPAGEAGDDQEQEPEADQGDESEGDESEEEGEEGEEGEGENLADLEYPKFKKRVDKLTRQKKELQGQLDALNQRIQQIESGQGKAEQPSPAKKTSDPFASLKTLEEVQAKVSEAQSVWDWGLRMLEGTEDSFVIETGNGEEEELSREDVRNIIERAQYTLQTVLPQKAQYIQQRAAYDQLAQEHYEWLADQESAEYREAQQIMAVFPELAQFPDINLSLGDLIEGRKAREAKMKTKKSSAAPNAPKIAPPQPSRSSSPAPIDKKKVAAKDAMQAVFAGGGQRGDLETLFRNL